MHLPKECWFDHERLEVYQESIAFIAWLPALLDGTVRIGEVKDQLDRASISIPLNIAEGNGKYAPKPKDGALPRAGLLRPALSTCKNGRFSEVFCNLAPSSVVLGHGFSQKARVFDGFPC
jgi:23S rRNA-intervening sequence protein